MIASIKPRSNSQYQYLYDIVVTDNPTDSPRTAIVDFYGSPSLYQELIVPIYRYIITQDGKNVSVNVYASYTDRKLRFYNRVQCHVKSNCPFKLEEPINCVIESVIVKQDINGEMVDLVSTDDGYYGTTQKGDKEYYVEFNIRRKYSQTVSVISDSGYDLLTGDESDEIGRSAITITFSVESRNEAKDSSSLKMSNLIRFSQKWSSNQTGTPTHFTTAIPEIAATTSPESSYKDNLEAGKYVAITPNSATWTYTQLEDLEWYIGEYASPGNSQRQLYLCWDGCNHGYICTGAGFETDVAGNFIPLFEVDMEISSNSTSAVIHLYVLNKNMSKTKVKRGKEYTFLST